MKWDKSGQARTVSRRNRRLLGLLVLCILAVVCFIASLMIGARALTPMQVWHGLTYDYSLSDPVDPVLNEAAIIVQTLRVPRTLLGLIVGMSLGAAGALIQGHTRNPIADPGLLGITQGAAFAVVVGLFLFKLSSPMEYVWFAFAGAGIAALTVFGLSSIGKGGASPLTLVLCGSGVSVFLAAMTTAIALRDQATLDAIRFWNAGSVAGRGFDVLWSTAGFMVCGLVLALVNAPAVNILNLGDDVAQGLGMSLYRARVIGIVGVTIMTGAATAACGSVAFIGLIVPHIARFVTGPDYRWLMPYSALIGAVLLLLCDVIGRVVAPPGELQVGIVLALIGAPFFIALVWWRRAVTL